MPITQDASPSVEIVLDTLGKSAEARQSRAGAFIYVHAQVILSCLHAGYGAAQIYQGLEDLGFHPPMSTRQFRRYVRQIKVAAGLEGNRRSPPEPSPGPNPRNGMSKATLAPTSVPPRPYDTSTPSDKPSTFDWDPTADIDAIR